MHSIFSCTIGSFFNAEQYGKDTLVKGDPTPWVADDIVPSKRNAQSIEEFVGQFPLSQEARSQLIELYTSKRVTLSNLTTAEAKMDYLSKISYTEFLRKDWGLCNEAVSYFQNRTLDFFGLPPEMIPALDVGYFGYPGLQGIDLPKNEEAEG